MKFSTHQLSLLTLVASLFQSPNNSLAQERDIRIGGGQVKTSGAVLSTELLADPKQAEFPTPKTPEESLASIRTKPGLLVELVASEPFVVDPVAIDFGPDGKLWVAEMRDFPMGLDGKWKAGGRVKFLEDADGDGKYDKATLFLDDLPFPTGVMAWNKGVLVCAAPDIIYAEDTDRDGRADRVQKLFSGFATDNYQARVNGLSLGLDNWIYGANGLIGGSIRTVGRVIPGTIGGIGRHGLNIRGRDFRMHPNTGEFETASGLSQQGRVRDDWGNWFGCDNSNLVWHYPMAEYYARRNPHASPPSSRVAVADEPDANQLYPISRTLMRFNDPGHANRVTSACGIGIYRDALLGDAFYNNAFVCEPVHNLVHRLVLSESGVTFSGRRAPDEQKSEFLASTDNWFRPVQACTGPDGALWVVDMYRFVVEHPRWITPDRLKELDLRAGDDKGRIYRVYPKGEKLRPIRDLTKLGIPGLVTALDTSNGVERDRIHLELLHRQDGSAIIPLKELATKSPRPVCRIQALALLDGLKGIDESVLLRALADPIAGVREQAVRLSERFINQPRVKQALLARVNDASWWVQYQLALSLGETPDSAAGHALAELATKGKTDVWLNAAIISSSRYHAGEVLHAVLDRSRKLSASSELVPPLVETAMNADHQKHWVKAIIELAPRSGQPLRAWQLAGLASLLEALQRKDKTLESLNDSPNRDVRSAARRIASALGKAIVFAKDEFANESVREAAIVLLGYCSVQEDPSKNELIEILDSPASPRLQRATLQALARHADDQVARHLLARWQRYLPRLRSDIVDLMLRRDESARELLESIAGGKIQPREISAAHRQKLFRHANGEIQQRASTLFSNKSEPRASVLNQYQSVLDGHGDAVKGVAYFAQLCASCHRMRGQGNAVGPSLDALTDKSSQFLLTAILDPNSAVEDRFINYLIETRDGQSLSGTIVDETASSVVLAGATGVRQPILRNQITEIRATNLSMMPEGLEQSLPPEAMADLIAYIQRPVPAASGN
jgi:putative membrane-bound dehydrogenase-like protein